jgi:NTE family protein
MNRRNALLSIGALTATPFALSGCVEFASGYPESDTPRESPIAWPPGRARTALVLGSGGPRGFAHVGTLKAIESAGIEPTLIVGSSAGSIIGALYAAKISAIEIEKRALELGLTDIADPSITRPNRMIGRALQNIVNLIVDHRRMEDLPRRFCAVAVPLGESRAVAFTAGNVGAAVRASSALPSIFLPATIGNRKYEDGDTVSPVPIRIARALGATHVVAVDVSAWAEDTPPNAYEDWKKRDDERRAIIFSEAKEADFLLRIRLPYYAGASRAYRENVIALAEAQTLAALAQIRSAFATAAT